MIDSLLGVAWRAVSCVGLVNELYTHPPLRTGFHNLFRATIHRPR